MDHLAHFHCFGLLQNLIVRSHQAGHVDYPFNQNPAVKDAIEALGIPHTEVDVVVVAGRSVGLDYALQPGDRVEVYPFGWPVGLDPLLRLIPPAPEPLRFILDVHLGTLARRLRLLGFDCLYRNDYADAEIVRIALEQQRIILTRDRGLLKRRLVAVGCLLDSDWPEEQLRAVNARYALHHRIEPLGRCPSCNGLLQPVEKQLVADRLEPKTLRFYDVFVCCEGCSQIYWHGSHTGKILAWIERIQKEFAQVPVAIRQ